MHLLLRGSKRKFVLRREFMRHIIEPEGPVEQNVFEKILPFME
jgi:hypothetical protein